MNKSTRSGANKIPQTNKMRLALASRPRRGAKKARRQGVQMKNTTRSGAETNPPDKQNEAGFSQPSAPRGIAKYLPLFQKLTKSQTFPVPLRATPHNQNIHFSR